jgi:predicted CopG family antitoxin
LEQVEQVDLHPGCATGTPGSFNIFNNYISRWRWRRKWYRTSTFRNCWNQEDQVEVQFHLLNQMDQEQQEILHQLVHHKVIQVELLEQVQVKQEEEVVEQVVQEEMQLQQVRRSRRSRISK